MPRGSGLLAWKRFQTVDGPVLRGTSLDTDLRLRLTASASERYHRDTARLQTCRNQGARRPRRCTIWSLRPDFPGIMLCSSCPTSVRYEEVEENLECHLIIHALHRQRRPASPADAEHSKVLESCVIGRRGPAVLSLHVDQTVTHPLSKIQGHKSRIWKSSDIQKYTTACIANVAATDRISRRPIKR